MNKLFRTIAVGATIGSIILTTMIGCTTSKTQPAASSTPVNTSGNTQKPTVVNVYSARDYDVDKILLKDFEKESGIRVNLVEGKANELIERMVREGEDSQADLFLNVGAENIYVAHKNDLLQPYTSEVITKNIPEAYRGEDWIGLTSRARIIVYSKDRVDPKNLSTYQGLTDDKWKGKVLVRSSSSSYNQALLSSMIQLDDEEIATSWASGIVSNFARQPEGNDRDQVKGIAAQIGDVAIVNSYYISKLLTSSDPEEVKAGQSVGVFFPEETHVNISWGGITKYAKNKENAIKLMEYLTDVKAQNAYSKENGEYPLNLEATVSDLLKSWGTFNPQKIDFEKLGEVNQKAVIIFDKIGWK